MKMPRLRAVIAVADQATRPLRNIQRRFRDSIIAPAALARTRLSALGRDVGLQRVGRNLANVTRQAQGFAAGAMKAAGALGLIGGTASVAGLVSLTRSHASASAAIRDTATRLGVTAGELVGYRYAAEQAGAAANVMDNAQRSLNLRLQDAASGKNQDVLALFQKLGIQVRDASGAVRRAADVMPELADAFKANENAALRTKMAVALFEAEGVSLIPTLAQGRKEFERMSAEGQRLAGVTDEMVRRGGILGDTYTKLDAAVAGLRNVVADGLVPVLTPLLERMSEWIVANREVVAQRVSETVERIARAVDKVDFAALARTAATVGTVLGTLVDQLGGTENAILALGALALLPTALRIAQFVLAVGQLAGSLGVLVFNLAVVAKGFAGLALSVGPVAWAVGLVKGAFAGLVAFFAAAPFAVILAAVAAVAGAAFLLYRNWDGVVGYFQRLGETLGAAFRGLADMVGGVVTGDFARAAAALSRVWDGMVAVWRIPLDAAVGTVRAIAAEIDGLFGTAFGPAVDRVVAVFAGLGERVGPVLSGLADMVRGAIGTVVALMRGDFAPAVDRVVAVFAGLGERVGPVLTGFADMVRGAVGAVAALMRGDLAGAFDAARAAGEGWGAAIGNILGGIRDLVVGVVGALDAELGERLARVLAAVEAKFDGLLAPLRRLRDAARSVLASVGLVDDPEPAAAPEPAPGLREAAARQERGRADAIAAAAQRVQVDGAPGEPGRVAVEVDFRNVPQGASVRTQSRGAGIDVETGVTMAAGMP